MPLNPLDDPQSQEFLDSCKIYSPESTDGRAGWRGWLKIASVLEIVSVLLTACVLTIFIWWGALAFGRWVWR